MRFLCLLLAMAGSGLVSCYPGLFGSELHEIHRHARQAHGKGSSRSSCPQQLKIFRGKRKPGEKEKDSQANSKIELAKQLIEKGIPYEDIKQELESCSKDTTICDRRSIYRTADGSCNNLENPTWGQAGTIQGRLVPAAYEDGVSEPRATSSIDGSQLPNVRQISNVVHAGTGKARSSKFLTLHTFQFGQFLDHDLIATPRQAVIEDCCSSEGQKDLTNCLPIIVEEDDEVFSKGYCMPFQRSAPVFCPDRAIQREQKNDLTSFIDASNVYGSSLEEQAALRYGGMMKMEAGKHLPNDPNDESCLSDPVNGIYCPLAGDHRVAVVPSLIAYHTLFVREHNRIARAISRAFTDKEKLFQETKKYLLKKPTHDGIIEAKDVIIHLCFGRYKWKIVHGTEITCKVDKCRKTRIISNHIPVYYIVCKSVKRRLYELLTAVMQKIVYDEFLESFLSDETMSSYGLRSSASYTYNKTLNPSITNDFGMAYRLGHTWIPSNMEIFDRNLKRVERVPTEENFLRPDLTYRPADPPGLEGLAYWLSGNKNTATDRIVQDAARNRLFQDSNGDALDLAALNLQRGRDHGLPPYNVYREFCQLQKLPDKWQQGNRNIVDHDQDTTRRLKNIYASPLDIDLWTGALTETPVDGSDVGPTLNCILGEQFNRLKYGDRFWYQGTVTGYSSEQLDEINKASMSRILCDNFNFGQIHRNAFIDEDLVDCSEIPRMDLTKFGATQN